MLTTESQINLFQWKALKGALTLEIAGMKRSTKPSAFIIAKRKLGIKGGREKILEEIKNKIKELECLTPTTKQ